MTGGIGLDDPVLQRPDFGRRDFHLVTRFTSLVAVDVTPAGTPAQTCETRPVPLNLPAGWGGIEDGMSLPSTATPAPVMLLAGLLLIALAIVIGRM